MAVLYIATFQFLPFLVPTRTGTAILGAILLFFDPVDGGTRGLLLMSHPEMGLDPVPTRRGEFAVFLVSTKIPESNMMGLPKVTDQGVSISIPLLFLRGA